MKDEKIKLEFCGRYAKNHRLPASVLTQTVSNLQSAIYILAMEQEEKPVNERERVSSEIEKRYVLLIEPPLAGSWTVEAVIGDPSGDISAAPQIINVVERFLKTLKILSGNAIDELSKEFKDSNRMMKYSSFIIDSMPKEKSGIDLTIKSGKGKTIAKSKKVIATINEMTSIRVVEKRVMPVIGYLFKIDFKNNKFTLNYPGNERSFLCPYDQNQEKLLLGNARNLIQVCGEVEVDSNDLPVRIIKVEDIREVDLSPFYLNEFEYDSYRIKFREPLNLEPCLDESKQLFLLQHEKLGIDIFAYTRDELEIAVREELDVLWRNYAKADDSELTEGAIRLKSDLLAAIEEFKNANG
jgi:hypothetical protein